MSLLAPTGARSAAGQAPVPGRFDLRRTLGVMCIGRFDPTTRVDDRQLWWATLTPHGPGTLHLWFSGSPGAAGVDAEAWGPGADHLLAQVPRLVGDDDDPTGFVPVHPAVERAVHRFPGVRIAATGALYHHLLPNVLGQRVTGREAVGQWSALCRRLGEPAPGPTVGLRLPPAPESLARRPYWWFHRYGIERKRADALVQVARHGERLEAAVPLGSAEVYRRLRLVTGVGPWTAAMACGPALGDADAVPVGDFHLPHLVSWSLAGEPRGTDARMLDLLAPYAGHRGRALRLLALGGPWAPKFGPRQAIVPIARL